MRNLGAIIGILLDVVAYLRQHSSLRCAVTFQFVGDHSERPRALTTHQSANESLGCALIAARLQQNIDDVSILIDRTPEVVLLAIDSDEQFVQIPDVAKATLSSF